MIIYNVTVKVQPAIAAEWLQWMQGEHMPEIMATGYFTASRICHLLEMDESDGVTYSVQYTATDMSQYQRYIAEHAPALREKTMKAFGDRLIAFRTVMEIVSSLEGDSPAPGSN